MNLAINFRKVADNPLPTSIAFLAVDNSDKFPKTVHRLFWADMGSIWFGDQ